MIILEGAAQLNISKFIKMIPMIVFSIFFLIFKYQESFIVI